MNQYAIMFDMERCIGCKSCESACKIENGVPEGRYRTRVIWVDPQGGRKLYFVSIPCMHCGKPACKEACPVGAISKRYEDGVVLIDKDRCIGCRYCVWACPFGAMVFDEERMTADKCTYCAHRLARGEEPACVVKCPGHALSFGKASELVAKVKSDVRWLKNINSGTNPSTLYIDRMKP